MMNAYLITKSNSRVSDRPTELLFEYQSHTLRENNNKRKSTRQKVHFIYFIDHKRTPFVRKRPSNPYQIEVLDKLLINLDRQTY